MTVKLQNFVFLDRDGVINVERDDYTTTINQWEWAPNSLEGIKLLTDNGFGIIVITNQSCIAKGLQTEENLAKLHAYILEEIRKAGGEILRIYHCPHQASDGCSCRKPKPGMILKAVKDYNIDLTETFLIGDSSRDIEAGIRAGARTIFIDGATLSGGSQSFCEQADFRVNDLLKAASIVLQETAV